MGRAHTHTHTHTPIPSSSSSSSLLLILLLHLVPLHHVLLCVFAKITGNRRLLICLFLLLLRRRRRCSSRHHRARCLLFFPSEVQLASPPWALSPLPSFSLLWARTSRTRPLVPPRSACQILRYAKFARQMLRLG